MAQPDRQFVPLRDEPGATPRADVDLARLLHAASSGDEDAWRMIVQLYARRVYALVRSRLVARGAPNSGARERSGGGLWAQGHDIAEEVTQSVFVTVATKLSTGEYTEQGRFESWLFRVAMNRIRDEARRVRRQATPTDPEALDAKESAPNTIGGAEEDADQLGSLRRAMHELSDADREVIELRHHAGLSFKQMAELLSEPLGTLLARHHRALRKLKEIMTGEAGTPAHAAEEQP